MIEALVALVLASVAYLVGSRRGGKAERDKQVDAYSKRKERIDAAGNDVDGLDRNAVNERLRNSISERRRYLRGNSGG